MEYEKYSAKTVNEAVTQACLRLGVTSDRLEYEVVQEPTSGFLGIGSKPAVIRARVRAEEKKEDETASSADSKPAENESSAVPTPEKKAEPDTESRNDAAKAETPEAGGSFVSADEIEKRAAAAAAREKVEGRRPEKKTSAGRDPERRGGDRRRYDRRDSRHGSRGGRPYRENNNRLPIVTTTAPHEPSQPKPERVVRELSEEEVASVSKAAVDFLTDVLNAMQMKATITTSYDQKEGALSCSFDGDDMGLLIGKRGQTLDSLQYLTSLVVNKNTDEYIRVKLDTEGYRSRRAETLNNLARNIAYKVKKTQRPVALEPMNPYERRIIHSALQSSKFVETYSEGEEPYRHVVVAPKHR
jgi:spoIIIJ-associated protein